MSAETVADWCEDFGSLVICGTKMEEYSRTEWKVRWCFACRKRVMFEDVVMSPVGISYYGPTSHVECTNCHGIETDLFPGWYREAPDY